MTADRDHERNRCIDLPIRPRLGRIQVATPIRFPDNIADAPCEYGVVGMV
jgi:hypothetical protein